MNSSEMLLILIVALIVFGPDKLPMLARHLGRMCQKLGHFKTEANRFWQAEMASLQLEQNQKKAEKADILYKNNNPANDD